MSFITCIKNFIYPCDDEPSNNEILFHKFLREVVNDKETYFNCVKNYNSEINFICNYNYAKYDVVRYFYSNKIIIRNCSFYDRFHNIDVILSNVRIVDIGVYKEEFYFTIKYKNKETSYHSYPKEHYKKIFYDGCKINSGVYELFKEDFKKYGYWLDYENGNLILRMN